MHGSSNPSKLFDLNNIDKTSIITISIILAILYLWHLGLYPLINPDEGRYAEIPREMLASGNFITPHLNGVEYFEKPALQYWVTAFFMYIFGENEFSVRLFPALCALGQIATTAYLAKKMFNRTTAFIASIILGSSFLYLIIGSLNILDMAISFFITISMTAFYQFSITLQKKYIYLFYVSIALGTLTKGLIAIVLTFGIVFIYALLTKNFKLIFKTFSPVGILIFLAICVPWFYLVCRNNPDFFYFFFIHEHFLRYLTTTHHRYQPFYFFIPCIILGIFPWTGFFFSCLLSKSPKKTWHKFLHNPDRFKFIYLCLWFCLIFIFYSLSDSKLVPYILPCLIPLSILIAYHLQQIFYQPKKIGIALIINAIISALIIIALIITAIKSDFISLQEFIFSGSFIILVLIIFNLISLITWYKYKNLKQLLSIHIITAILFSFSLQPVITQVAQHRTGKDIAETINTLKTDDTLIIMYKDYIQDIPFYTKSRVAIYDYLGELDFGAKHPSGQGWFLDKEQLLTIWAQNPHAILVVPKKHQKDCFKVLSEFSNLTYFELNRYIIITH